MERKTVYVEGGGVRRTLVTEDDTPGVIRTYTEQDMTSVVETNKIMRELHPQRSTNKLVARGIPMSVYEKSIHEDWGDDDWKKWLNDPDNAAFRIWQGQV
jgi:hypothetical protein